MPPHARGSVRDLLAVLEPAREIVILPHDNPDPDSLASAEGLRAAIRHALRKPVAIGLSGIIGRSQNRAMVSTLRLELEPIANLEQQLRETVVLVDTQPGRKNNSLPPGVTPAAVIDHHPDWGNNEGVSFLDLREGYGATSTIVTEYLQELEFPLHKRLATALFYGITSETRNLGREAQPADIVASQFLYPYVDKRALAEIDMPRLKASCVLRDREGPPEEARAHWQQVEVDGLEARGRDGKPERRLAAARRPATRIGPPLAVSPGHLVQGSDLARISHPAAQGPRRRASSLRPFCPCSACSSIPRYQPRISMALSCVS